MKTKIIIVGLVIISSIISWAQNDSFIIVYADSRVEIPAVEITFAIHIEQVDANPQNAFDSLKQLEKKFLPLLKKFNIPDSSVTYSLSQMRRDRGYNNQADKYTAGETVIIKLYDFKQYEPFQLDLLSIGIYNFNGTFSTTEISKAREIGFNKAIEKAEKEANIICKKLGRKLGKVLEVESNNRDYVATSSIQALQSGVVVQDRNLVDIPQYVTLNTNLKIKFELK
jgi:uncharacterized protein YggE